MARNGLTLLHWCLGSREGLRLGFGLKGPRDGMGDEDRVGKEARAVGSLVCLIGGYLLRWGACLGLFDRGGYLGRFSEDGCGDLCFSWRDHIGLVDFYYACII